MNPVTINTAEIPAVEVKILCSDILKSVEAWYENPSHRSAFEAWKRTQPQPSEEEVL